MRLLLIFYFIIFPKIVREEKKIDNSKHSKLNKFKLE